MFCIEFAKKDTMTWSAEQTTETYRLALLRVLAGLFVMAGMTPGGSVVSTLPRCVRSAILLILRPAEAAARRLIFEKAKSVEVPEYVEPPAKDRSKSKGKGKGTGKKRGPRKPLFRLIDPRKFLEEFYPNRRKRKAKPRSTGSTEPQMQVRIAGFDGQPDFIIWSEPKPLPTPDDALNAEPLCRRMLALQYALEDLPAQALRMAREMAKRKKAKPGPKRVPPLRYGYPPGYRQKPLYEVDYILRGCSALARMRPQPADTS